MSDQDIRQALRDYITRLRPGAEVDDDESLLEAGVLDSMAIMQLNEFIEDKLGAAIDDADFEPENYETIATIAAMVSRIKAG